MSKRINVGREQKVQIYVTKNPIKLEKSVALGKIPRFNKRRAFNKAVGPGKIYKSINVGLTFIPDYRVGIYSRRL